MLSFKFLDDSNGISNWDSLEVVTDPHKLAQIFSNVISNSLKFTPRNGSIEIQISTVPGTHTSTSGSTSTPSIFSWFPSLFSFSHSSTTAKPPVVTNMVKIDIIDSGVGISQVLLHYLTTTAVISTTVATTTTTTTTTTTMNITFTTTITITTFLFILMVF